MTQTHSSSDQPINHQIAPGPIGGDVPGPQPMLVGQTVVHTVRVARRRIPVRLQVGIQIDRTSSSLAFETGIHTGIETFLGVMQNQVSDVTTYLGSHGDLDYGESYRMHLEAGSPQEVLQICPSIQFDGGGDGPEHHLDGIAEMVERVPWTMDHLTRKVMIGFVNDLTKPDRELQELVNAAKGMMITISNNPDVEEIKRAAAAISRSLTATLTSGGTIPMATLAP
ncbi:MAG: hypothetical protein IT445_10110 [Phycisphaeraceae bacterium]|nr:hypothetical protein [Phycisphaeraceae bacterium]